MHVWASISSPYLALPSATHPHTTPSHPQQGQENGISYSNQARDHPAARRHCSQQPVGKSSDTSSAAKSPEITIHATYASLTWSQPIGETHTSGLSIERCTLHLCWRPELAALRLRLTAALAEQAYAVSLVPSCVYALCAHRPLSNGHSIRYGGAAYSTTPSTPPPRDVYSELVKHRRENDVCVKSSKCSGRENTDACFPYPHLLFNSFTLPLQYWADIVLERSFRWTFILQREKRHVRERLDEPRPQAGRQKRCVWTQGDGVSQAVSEWRLSAHAQKGAEQDNSTPIADTQPARLARQRGGPNAKLSPNVEPARSRGAPRRRLNGTSASWRRTWHKARRAKP
jgi:hypothetical protein